MKKPAARTRTRNFFLSILLFFLLSFLSSPRFRFSFLLLFALLAGFYCLCLKLGSIEVFWRFLERLAFSLGGKALSFALRGLGCSGGLTFAILFAVRTMITEEAESIKMMMAPSGIVAQQAQIGQPCGNF